jgi:hypothetical protein
MQNYSVNGVDIPFNPTWKSIAVSVSGGADSALLAYLLSSMIPTNRTKFKIHIISHTRMWKTRPWQSYDSLRIYNYLVDRFPHISFERHTNFIAPELEYGNMGPSLTDEYGKSVSGDNIEQRAFAEFICHTKNVNAYYNAVTRNPKDVELGGMAERDIDPSNDNQHLRIMTHMGRWALHPFRFISKDWVVKQYVNLKLMDLFSLTRSCEGEFEGINYQTYTPEQKVPVCNECFWCRERAWALTQNGLSSE